MEEVQAAPVGCEPLRSPPGPRPAGCSSQRAGHTGNCRRDPPGQLPWLRLTKWEGRARRARGGGRRWGHTTSYCSTWGRGALGKATVGEKGVSRPVEGLYLRLWGSPRTAQGPDTRRRPSFPAKAQGVRFRGHRTLLWVGPTKLPGQLLRQSAGLTYTSPPLPRVQRRTRGLLAIPM